MVISQTFKFFGQKLLNLLFPGRCLSCQVKVNQAGALCSNCWNSMEFISSPSCSRCSNPFPYDLDDDLCFYCKEEPPEFTKAFAVVKYDEFSDKIIFALKYYDKTDLAYSISKLMLPKLKEIASDVDIITCVPIHFNKLKKRGFNQAALLAKHIATELGHKVNPSILLKHKETISQSGLTKNERLENIKGSVKINPKYKKEVFRKNVLLIDDVITTGATINECCKKLKKVGAKKIHVLTFAKTCM
jgi:ComF family protein